MNTILLFSGPPDPCQIPHTPCWCQSHPQSCGGCWPPPCVSITDGVELLVIAAVVLVFVVAKKNKKK